MKWQHSVLDPFLSGIKQGFRTDTACLALMDDLRLQLNKSNPLLLLLLDLSAAFEQSTVVFWWIDCNQSLEQKGQPSISFPHFCLAGSKEFP